MSSYRIGQPIKDSVADVIRERQELLKARRSTGANEFYSEYALSFFNSKTPWVRLSSAVDIQDIAKAEYFDVNTGDQLARENVLQGTSEFDQGYLDYYKEGERLQGTFDRQQLGLRPKPGITNVSTTSHGMFGALRTTEITVLCWTPFDLDIIDSLYMRPGYSVLLEMGHTHYMNSDFTLQDDIIPIDFFKYGSNESEKLLSDIQQKRETYRGSYEALYGVVKNFSWTLRPDGGYECKIKLVSKGEVLESLITTGITDKVNLGSTEGTTPLDGILDLIEVVADNKRDSLKSAWLDLEERWFSFLVGQSDLDKYSELKGIYSYRVLADKTKKSSFETHITLGLFNAIINGLIIIENETTTYTKIHSQLDSNQFKTVSGHYSINPRICLLPKDGVTIGGVDFKLEKNPYTPTEVDYGNGINSILISTSMIRAAIRNSLNTEENTISVVSLYRYIFNAIQNNTGNINSFSLHLDEKTNTWHIVDRLFLNTQDIPVELSILGLDSFAKGIMLQSMLSPRISSLLAIGAQASQNPNSTLDSTAFSTLNRGLEDRLVPVREYPKKINPKTEADADKLVEDTAYLKDYITSIYFNNVGRVRKYSIADNVDRIAPIYRDKLNRSIQTTPKNGISFAIPFELTLTLDGIGGLAIGESFTISSDLLPLSYKRLIETESTYRVDTSNSQIGFLITGLNQQVNETSWDTVVRCQMYVLHLNEIPDIPVLEDVLEDVIEDIKDEPSFEDFVSNTPWSAAFIVYCVTKRGINFPRSAAHTGYAQAIRNGGYPFTALDPATTKLKRGDIIIKNRSSNTLKFSSNTWSGYSHGDIVNEVSSTETQIAGGNLDDTVKVARITLSDSKLINVNKGIPGSYFVVLRPNNSTDATKIANEAIKQFKLINKRKETDKSIAVNLDEYYRSANLNPPSIA